MNTAELIWKLVERLLNNNQQNDKETNISEQKRDD